MTIDYATGGELLERYGRAWQAFDGDAWVDLFTEDVEYHEDPFEPPLVGHNAVRAYLLEAAERQERRRGTTCSAHSKPSRRCRPGSRSRSPSSGTGSSIRRSSPRGTPGTSDVPIAPVCGWPGS